MRLAVRILGPVGVGTVLLVTVAACSGSPGPGEPTPKAPYTQAPPTPELVAIATVAPTGHGRPYSPEMIAAELQDVQFGLAPELQSPFIAAALADRIWTYDGRPYREMWFSGSCDEAGAGRCELSVQGLPDYAPTRESEDYYHFEVDLRSGAVRLAALPGGKGFPAELIPEIDGLVRSLDTEGRLEGLTLSYVLWAFPPPDDAFIVRYETGDLEGDRWIHVTVDRANQRILSMEQQVCC